MTKHQQDMYKIINCLKCGAANGYADSHCRKCDAELEKGVFPNKFVWFILAYFGSMSILFILGLLNDTLSNYIYLGLFFLGAALSISGGIWARIESMGKGSLWGNSIFFLFAHPSVAFWPFFIQTVGGSLIIFAELLFAILGKEGFFSILLSLP